MKEQHQRTALLFGEAAIEKLGSARVAVFGIGGVGGAAVEALARAGVGTLDLIDSDCVSESNINRQLIALHSTVGMEKTRAAAERIAHIDPDITVNCHNIFFLPENAAEFDFSAYDYIIDCIDTVSGKLALIEGATRAGVPVISSMGTGNKVDPTLFQVSDVYKTSVCPLAKVMRRELTENIGFLTETQSLRSLNETVHLRGSPTLISDRNSSSVLPLEARYTVSVS